MQYVPIPNYILIQKSKKKIIQFKKNKYFGILVYSSTMQCLKEIHKPFTAANCFFNKLQRVVRKLHEDCGKEGKTIY